MARIPTYAEKTALADNDLFIIADSAASNASKRVKASTVWKTDLITEKTAAAGVTIAGTGGLKANLITDNGANMAIRNLFAGGSLDLTTLDTNLTLFSGSVLALRTANNGDLDMIVHGTGVVTMNGAPTYTGTVAGAAGLNIVNGLVIA